jgi:hypothetical protein
MQHTIKIIITKRIGAPIENMGRIMEKIMAVIVSLMKEGEVFIQEPLSWNFPSLIGLIQSIGS